MFYAVGRTNDAFEQVANAAGDDNAGYEEMKFGAPGLAKSSERPPASGQQFRIEKFFIDCEDTF